MNRLEALTDRATKYPYKKSAQRLSDAEFDLMVEFIEDNDHLGHLEFEYAANRFFLNGNYSELKHSHKSIITELLIVCNAAVHMKPRLGRIKNVDHTKDQRSE